MRKGFTLIEVIIVLGILGALFTLVFIGFTGVQANARDARRREDIDQVNTAIQQYRQDNGSYPVADTYTGLITILQGANLVQTEVQDPRNGIGGFAYQYGSDGIYYALWATLENDFNGSILYYRSDPSGAIEITGAPTTPTATIVPSLFRPYGSPTPYTQVTP